MNKLEVVFSDFKNAPEGAILIKKKDGWQTTTIDELVKDWDLRIKEIEKLPNEFRALAQNNKHFKDYCKSHFQLVFNSFINQILLGEIVLAENENDLLLLDIDVLDDRISVEEAIKKHPYIYQLYKDLFLNKKSYKIYPEV